MADKAEVVELSEEPRKASQAPEVKGYRILVAPIVPEEKTEGGIIKPDQLMDLEKTASVCGLVIGMGDDCYKDKKRFKEPWCKNGDFVLIGAYRGTRIKVHNRELRIVNDDQILATVNDPRGYERA